MTAEIPGELLDSIRSARACMVDIRALAGKLGDLSPGQTESILQAFLDTGEDQALSRLLQVCAFNGVKLDPKILCGCIDLCEDILDSAPCFALQDERAIEPLLGAATAEALPLERQIYAAGLAAELTVRFGLDPQPVRKVLWKLEHTTRSPQIQALIAQSLRILEEGPLPDQAQLSGWCDFQLSDLLPEQRPRTVVGGNYTVRRPIPKLGRNDPCHCGSGKKYKKCCYAKDQELLRDASSYAGTTRTDLKTKPGLVDDPAVIVNMRAHELKKLTPAALSEGQLHSGYQRALAFGLRELAFEMLVEWERRSQDQAFDQGHFEDLIEGVLQAGDLDLAHKIRDHCADHAWWRPQAIEFRFDLLENPERFEPLERDRKAKRIDETTLCIVEEDGTEKDKFSLALITVGLDLFNVKIRRTRSVEGERNIINEWHKNAFIARTDYLKKRLERKDLHPRIRESHKKSLENSADPFQHQLPRLFTERSYKEETKEFVVASGAVTSGDINERYLRVFGLGYADPEYYFYRLDPPDIKVSLFGTDDLKSSGGTGYLSGNEIYINTYIKNEDLERIRELMESDLLSTLSITLAVEGYRQDGFDMGGEFIFAKQGYALRAIA